MRAIASGLTDVGLQRDHNEDSYAVLSEYDLFIVADGIKQVDQVIAAKEKDILEV